MKPKRYFFGLPLFPVATIRYGAPVFAGLTILISGIGAGSATAAIYGGSSSNSPSAPQPGTAPVGGTAPDASATVRANALEALARTQQAVGAAAALQAAARAAAANSNNAGQNPNNPGQTLPDVPNGLVTGGLQVAPGATTGSNLWQGAELPTEAIAGGLSTVTVRQTAQQALLTWQTFNVGKNTTLKFDQSNTGAAASQSIAFNKVVDPTANPTQILGQIQAQGQVYIINPNGIIFGGASTVDVGALTASSLPINDNLVARGLLNNPTQEFLFNGLGHTGKLGDVTVNAGARLTTPVSADGNGGRIALVGANVTNNGTLTSPNGQIILAAGLQVGIAAHASTDPSLRGLDIYVGAVTDPASALNPYAGTATNNGIIDIPRASTILTGKAVHQNGIITSTTSVALNGRIDLSANYDAISNPSYNASIPSTGDPFLFRSTGTVTLAENSVTRILPETESTATTIGAELALRSQINIKGRNVHFASGSIILAPNAIANVSAGTWNFIPDAVAPTSTFVTSTGQIHLAENSLINLAGTVDATASVTQNLLTLELRGSELAVAPVQREGELRGDTITVDISKTGTYEGRFWVGTPLADLTGYVGLIQRNVGQLTTAGGTLNLSAGGSVVIQNGATVDVSSGWTNFTGGKVYTTQVISGGRLVDISEALPNETYSGIFNPNLSVSYGSWGVTDVFSVGILPNGPRYQEGFTQGANGGTLNLTAPAMALDGNLLGHTIAGTNQIRNTSTTSSLPQAASLNLKFQSQLVSGAASFTYYPIAPDIEFRNDTEQTPVASFEVDASGNATPLPTDRLEKVYLSPDLLITGGFGNLSVSNPEGSILVPEDVSLATRPGGSIALTSSNIEVRGDITTAGGSLSFNVHNISPFLAAQQAAAAIPIQLPITPGLGIFTLSEGATLSTAGTITDDRFKEFANQVALPNGGSISISAYSADLENGSTINVSGGYAMTSKGTGKFGNAGSVSIKTGQDISQGSAIGGSLSLGSTLLGYSGAKAGSLSLQANTIQIGGTSTGPNTLHLAPSFFNEGGFGTFTLTGLAASNGNPAVLVAPDTVVEPIVKSLVLAPQTNEATPVALQVFQNEVGQRQAAVINLAAPGVRDVANQGLAHRGDIVVSEGAIIRTDPTGGFSASGNTVSILGSIITPGGSISIGGGTSTATIFNNETEALVTTYLGENAVLSAAGTTVLQPDPFGRRIGKVLDGGTITLTGNISASTGSVLDVSGSSSILDLTTDTSEAVPPWVYSNGTTTFSRAYIPTTPTRVDSNGGTINLRGGQVLATDSTLIANAGGSTALGGTLNVSSGRFSPSGIIPPPSTINLVVTQETGTLNSGIGSSAGNGGHFGVDTFTAGGFDSLSLGGVVSFEGPVSVDARGELRVATDGFIYANSQVHLNAAYAALGKALEAPTLPSEVVSPFGQNNILPTTGTGNLEVTADLIELGTLSMQGIGSAHLNATNGDIRGNGTVQISGALTLTAGQIYPVSATSLSLIAYNPAGGQGKIQVNASGTRQLPLSAGGTLSLYASVIEQNGTLRAPFGTINLGWDGTGTAPKDLIAGTAIGTFPITSQLTLGSSSVTSVSAIDPITGKPVVIPYGVSTDGENWIDPRGVDITTSGPPQKNILLSAGNITTQSGSNIDLRGGGDLLAYRFVPGLGGLNDILASSSSFAVIPGYSSNFAPVAEYNRSNSDLNLIGDNGAGYVNSNLRAGDRVYLSASASLPAGYYTLLPARYALLPGAVLVTPVSGDGNGSVDLADKSTVVTGHRFNSLNDERHLPTIQSRFEVASANVIKERALYEAYSADAFFAARAAMTGNSSAFLPKDAGYLLFQSNQNLDLQGSISSQPATGGRGAAIDISTTLNVHIGNGLTSVPGSISLDSSTLSSFGAESLLIGGKRLRTADGTTIETTSSNLTVNNSGSILSAKDLILVARNGLTIADGSSLSSTGTSSSPAENFTVTGNGALVRVAAGTTRTIRTGVTTATSPLLTIAAGTRIAGDSITLDSSSRFDLASSADLLAKAYVLNSGRISIQLDNPGTLQPDSGLLLTNSILTDLQGASSISLGSYSTIDIYGTGTFGNSNLANLSLNTGTIRGFNQSGGDVIVSAKNLTLGNPSNVAATIGSTPISNIAFQAETIHLSANQLSVTNFGKASLIASRGIIGEGDGTFSAAGNLDIIAPRITGIAGADRVISAGGSLSISSQGNNSNLVNGGLGSSLSLRATDVGITGTEIYLPSGKLDVRAATGDITVDGTLDVSGVGYRFGNTIRYTGGGEIQLTSDHGNITLGSNSIVDVSAPAGGGNAGSLDISTPEGQFAFNGELSAKGGANGNNGSFELDTATLANFAALSASLAQASFTQDRSFRVRNGDVVIDGSTLARTFKLAADQGSVTVTGLIDASGKTGGSIHLATNKNLTLTSTAELTVAAEDFSSAGKGGDITLEAGTQRNGIVGVGTIDLATGSIIDLSVDSKVAGSATSAGTSASLGKFSGKLHLRAPLVNGNTDIGVSALNSTIIDPSAVIVEGYRLYDLTSSGGQITTTVQNQILADGVSLLGAAGSTTANYTAITNRLLAGNNGLSSALVLASGAEIINRTGDLTLGTSGGNATGDWNLATFRFGAKSAAGVLTLRAAGNLVFNNSLSDGFTAVTPSAANGQSSMWYATLATQNELLPINAQSWSYRLTAGADLSGSDSSSVIDLEDLAADSGSLLLGRPGDTTVSGGQNARTHSLIASYYQVIRTGSGDIDINAGRNVQIRNQLSSIYSAGTRVTNPTLGGTFDVPTLTGATDANDILGAVQQARAASYSMAGGNVSISASLNIERVTVGGVADSQLQMPTNWLYRRGYVDPATGAFATQNFGGVSSTSWWVDFSNFFQGVGTLGGGNVTLKASHNVSNVDAVAATNARLAKGTPDAATLIELGGGDVTVRAGNNIDAGVYYVERGHGVLDAGNEILTNSTRTVLVKDYVLNGQASTYTELPTTLFVGKGGFDVSAGGDLLLGPIANAFLMPQGINNSYWHKTYFSTYSEDSYVNVTSLGGDVTLRQSATLPGGTESEAQSLLQTWFENKLLYSNLSGNIAPEAVTKPWLRLSETSVTPFATLFQLLPGTLRSTVFSGDINLVGDLTLSPSSKGTVELLANGSINALQPNGVVTLASGRATTWGTSTINLSDTSPLGLPGITSPIGRNNVNVSGPSAANTVLPLIDTINLRLTESGATVGLLLDTKQNLHASVPLHLNDSSPTLLLANEGDISGLTLFSPKSAQIIAGRDLSDISLYLQNLGATDTSIVSAGRDILAFNSASELRLLGTADGNALNLDARPLAGDIQISGPGTLQVLAGRNIDLGTGSNNPNGTGTGITSIGNTRNTALSTQGANLIIGASLGDAASLSENSNLDWNAFIDQYVLSESGLKHLAEIQPNLDFGALSDEEQIRYAVAVFQLILRDAGRNYSEVGNYDSALDAIKTLFGEDYEGTGNILARSRDIRTTRGGNIDILIPGGGLALANSSFGNTLSPPGIITESGGNISIFAKDDVSIGIGRIFTLRGGDEIIWSSDGNIAAGSSSKTVASAPPTRVIIDPQSAAVQTDLAGLATGGGIGVLATVVGVKPGNVDLIAPNGFVDAGDAGIRSAGNLNISANQVLNAGNISAGGVSTGTPISVSASINVGSLTTASNTTAANNAATQNANPQPVATEEIKPEEALSIFTVEVLGYGGSDEEDEEKKRQRQQLEEQQEQ